MSEQPAREMKNHAKAHAEFFEDTTTLLCLPSSMREFTKGIGDQREETVKLL